MGLNVNQKKVLAEFLNPETREISEIADAAGVVERTVYRYLQDMEFKRELNQQLGQLITAANSQLAANAGEAVDVLRELMNKAEVSDTNRRLAAVAVLDYMLKLQELLTITERLEALENKVFDY
jgi:AcrR family transcriptional regulator